MLLSTLALLLLVMGCPSESEDQADLVPDGTGTINFCQRDPGTGNLQVTIRNQGAAAAAASTTTVTFNPGGAFPVQTPAIAQGASATVSVAIPGACFNPDCEFTITVDSASGVPESNENNNVAGGSCIG